jgi:hypothetical protein
VVSATGVEVQCDGMEAKRYLARAGEGDAKKKAGSGGRKGTHVLTVAVLEGVTEDDTSDAAWRWGMASKEWEARVGRAGQMGRARAGWRQLSVAARSSQSAGPPWASIKDGQGRARAGQGTDED